ncbi:hypothetical protein TMatcc_006646 [Talaromyces marneffei ATCC 18224]|uniref:Uncharacterized protein n=2 Tax=Talaromyces marneffei TaxID=37727 RepID=B6Q9M1_TALMQ|nr:uncharacterized protein EYB26_002422 [Talaromyces marneffei]EEA25128.1 hypothetical protein PMAA_062540 [Talaromyces marneffei ATCC 18224]EEA25129.1 hypothetical protein PMAA_062540 [Talaromyces marneffei ATCC 18224]KAE8553869.1 hypothetical protein EYB25_002407 [Talaromyces marneffei]QGA14766.1 hypothetical protein EYB26_002422 [Talaromyces marneffei]
MASTRDILHPKNNGIPQLFHVLYISYHLQNDPNAVIQKLRVIGSYTSLDAAKTAAYSCLYDAGYSKSWFTQYDVHRDSNDGKVVTATGIDGTKFAVQILNSVIDGGVPQGASKLWNYSVEEKNQRVSTELFYVVQVKTRYDDEERREINIEGTFLTYTAARDYAKVVLLSPADGIDAKSYAEYDEAEPDQHDCGFGANVIVHAVGEHGENFLVSVVKSQTMENVRLGEAAMRVA